MRTFALATLFAAVYADAASDAAAVKAAADKVIADAAAAAPTAEEVAAAAAAALVRDAQLVCDSYWYTTTVTNGWTCADESTCEKKDADGVAMVDTMSKSAPRLGTAVFTAAVIADPAADPPVEAADAVIGGPNHFTVACGELVPGEVFGVYNKEGCDAWILANPEPNTEV